MTGQDMACPYDERSIVKLRGDDAGSEISTRVSIAQMFVKK
jgi:hypothetical protein